MVAFYLPGGIPIYLYSLLLAIGAFIGLAGIVLRAPEGMTARLVEAGLWALAGGLVGGRAAYVLAAWDYYQNHIGEAFQVYLGGLEWPGALAAGILALAVYALLSRQSLMKLADALVPLLAALSIASWLGCLVDGCGYGSTTAWGGIPSPDEWGMVAQRWPVQILSSVLCLTAFWMIDRQPNSRPSGLRACLMLFSLASIQLISTLLSVQSQSWQGLPLDAWAALIFAGLALIGLGILYSTRQRGR